MPAPKPDRISTAAAIAIRVAAAALGGYACAYASTAAIASLLPLSRNDAASFAPLLGYCIYVGVIIWAFAAASTVRMLGGMAGVLLSSIAIVWLRGMWR